MDRQINLMDLLKLYMKRWWCLVLAIIIGGTIAGVYTKVFVTPMYTSYGTLFTDNENDNGVVQSDAGSISLNTVMVQKELVSTYAEVLSSNTFLNKVALETQKRGLPYSGGQILSMLSMSDKNETQILVIEVTSPVPEHSFIIAQEIINMAPAQIEEIVKGGSVKKLDEPVMSRVPSSPNTMRNIEVGMFIGLLISLMIVFAIEMLDNKVKDADAIADTFKYPILGEVPYFTTTSRKDVRKRKKTPSKPVEQSA